MLVTSWILLSGVAFADPPSCEATELSTTTWKKAAPKGGRRMSSEIGQRSCVVDPVPLLASESACLEAGNRSSLDAALQARGWSRSGPAAERREVWGNEASGVVGRVFAPDPEQPAVQAIDLGVSLEPPACSGSEVVVAGTREAFVAAMPDGGLVVVQPVPEEVVRQHAACRCFPGCGAQQAAHGWHRWVSVEALEGPILGVVKLPYAATSLVVSAVDSTTCCCVP